MMNDKEKIERLERELENLKKKNKMLATAVESWRWYCGGSSEAVEAAKNIQLRKVYEEIKKKVEDEKGGGLVIEINQGIRDMIKKMDDALLLIDY